MKTNGIAWRSGLLKTGMVVLLAVIMALASAVLFARPAAAESLYIRKIVSVVCDDSGSMTGDKWAYANYALQAFCGMLNSEDRMYITYMSEVDGGQDDPTYAPNEIDLSAGAIQSSIDSIRARGVGGGTPYGAVETAFETLKGEKDDNINTQYWLVVITDGEFNECNGMDREEARSFLNERFDGYVRQTMHNGTTPRLTFLGIGDVVAPDADESAGIYTYSADDASGITDAMAAMADRISGRTRIARDGVQQVADDTIRVSSSIPLLNIVLFTQTTDAKVVGAAGAGDIPLSREAELYFPNYDALRGGAFLIGDSQRAIAAGEYEIRFDRAVQLEDLIVLFEPALEVRLTVTLNGQEVPASGGLDGIVAEDRVSVSYKIYEMGTNTEIAPSLLPPDTKFEMSVTEGGVLAEQVAGQGAYLADYEVKAVQTEIAASVTIEGFNPIRYAVSFTPAVKPLHDYEIVASLGGDSSSVLIDEIQNNRDVQIVFSVYDFGQLITDPEVVKGLQASVTLSPEGNDGTIDYTDDGKIVFTPNAAKVPAGTADAFDVTVTCTVDGASASQTYTVMLVAYEVVPTDAPGQVKKTEFFGNTQSVSFYVTRDGARLDKAAMQGSFAVEINEAHADLILDVAVADDGTVTVTPRAEQGRTLGFANWWGNWAYYWGLSGEDAVITLRHTYADASATIDVVGESIVYQLLNVYSPLLLELAIAIFLAAWIYLIVTKPRFPKGAFLYIGDISYDEGEEQYSISNFQEISLKKRNSFFGNGIWKFKKKADIRRVGGLRIRPDCGGKIVCEEALPFYKVSLTRDGDALGPKSIVDDGGSAAVERFSLTNAITGGYKGFSPVSGGAAAGTNYVLVPSSPKDEEKGIIPSGKIMFYTIKK